MSDDSKVPTARAVAEEIVRVYATTGHCLEDSEAAIEARYAAAAKVLEADRTATIEACARAVEAEQLREGLDNEGDKGYRQAIDDAAKAVRALSGAGRAT